MTHINKDVRASMILQVMEEVENSPLSISEYNNLPQVRESRFKPLEEKVCDKRFASMGIFNLSRESIVRYTLALFSPPLVTANGRVRSKANICAYLLDECFVGEKMTLERLFETIFELRGRVRVEGGQRNVFIERNPKQEYIMRKLELALNVINRMGIKDIRGGRYNFGVV